MPVSKVTFTAGLAAAAYEANDVVGGVLTFKEFEAGASVLLTSLDLRIHVTGIPSGMTSFRLHLYTKTPPSALADEAPWDLPAGDRPYYAGYVDLGSVADIGSTLSVQVDQVNRHVVVDGPGLYGYLVTNGAFTPAGNAETYTVTVRGVPI